VHANAIVVVYNKNPAVPPDQRVSGAQADADGSWDAEPWASSGDVIDVTQEVGTDKSPPVSVTIP
jgi:hypothetical protein